jgi:hypothetical protein
MAAPTTRPTTPDDLLDALAAGRIACMPPAAWARLAGTFAEKERHTTGVAGVLLIVDTPAGPAAVETPSDQEVVVRPLADADAVRRFVTDRLARYERMWEGCGCRIDYYR